MNPAALRRSDALPVETKQKLLIEIERLRNYPYIKRWSEPLLRNVE